MKLDDLPREILHHILSYGSCSDALILRRTTNYFRQIVDDPLFFKSVIFNRNGYGGIAWNYLPSYLNTEPTDGWTGAVLLRAKYAYADEKGRQFIGASHPSADRWPISLALLHHPVLEHDFYDHILHTFKPRLEPKSLTAHNDESPYAVPRMNDLERFADALCLAARLLSPKPFPRAYLVYRRPDNSIEHYHQDMRNHIHIAGNEDCGDPAHIYSGRRHITDELHYHLLHFLEDNEITLHQQIRTLLAAGIFAVKLRRALSGQTYRTRQVRMNPALHGSRDVPVPCTMTLPFIDYIDFQAIEPFSASLPPLSLHAICGRTMITKEFIEDGAWEGYCCESLGGHGDTTIDPPMYDIQFRVIANPHYDMLHLTGSGEDAIGKFTFRHGVIHQSSCQIRIFKGYATMGQACKWDGFMTPFGMVGSWRDAAHGGWFWIWKQKWTRASGS